MQIVIDIPNRYYEMLKDFNIEIIAGRCNYKTIQVQVINAIKKGTPLPKGHGRLIDENDLKTLYELEDRLWWSNAVKEFTDLPTIIEAEGSES